MATHSSILAWEISWKEETGGLQSMRLQQLDMTEQLNHYIYIYIYIYIYMYACMYERSHHHLSLSDLLHLVLCP